MGFSVIYFGEGMLPSNSIAGSGYGFLWEYGFREESERKERHADDCCVFLCEDSF